MSKKHRSVLLALTLAVGCCRDSTTPKQPDDPDIGLTDDMKLEVCTRAGNHLEELHCKQARPDFAVFCRDMLRDNIPLRPSCIAKVKTCQEINEVCR